MIQVENVRETAQFYKEHFGFKVMFDSDWYIHLQNIADPAINLAVLKHDHITIPEKARGPTRGVILTFEVEDAAKENERLIKAKVPVVQSLRDEPQGQRHAIYRDPNGILVDVVTPIEPSAEFLENYDPSALPTTSGL